MEKIKTKDTIELFNTPKKTFKLLDKTLKKDGAEIFITSREEGIYTIYDKMQTPVCSTGSIYNCLVGLLYYGYGVGKSAQPSWTMFTGESESIFDTIISQVQDPNMFCNLQQIIDNGGMFYYNAEKETASLKLPQSFNFAEDIRFRCNSFSDGISQMEGELVLLNQNAQVQQ